MKNSFRLACLALLLAPLAGCLGNPGPKEMTDEQKIDLYKTTADFLYRDNSLVRAQDQAVKVLKIDPRDREMRRMIGWIRLRMGSSEDVIIAEQFLRTLHREGDDHPATNLGLAIAVERLGVAYAGAAREYAEGTREPMDVEDPQQHAEKLQEKAVDYWEEARELFSSTLTDGEGSTRSKNGLQRVCALLGDYDGSLRWANEVLAEAELELVQWRRLLEAGDLAEDEEKLFRDNEIASLQLITETRLFAAKILHDQGRFDEAVVHLDAVIVARPREAGTYSRRAQLHMKRSDWQLAMEDLDRYLGLASHLAFDHPDIRRAFDLRTTCETELHRAAGS